MLRTSVEGPLDEAAGEVNGDVAEGDDHGQHDHGGDRPLDGTATHIQRIPTAGPDQAAEDLAPGLGRVDPGHQLAAAQGRAGGGGDGR